MSLLPQQIYQQNSVTTATPGELTLMLYKGALRFTNAAIAATQKNNIADASNYNLKAQAIVNELMITLNRDYEISEGMLAMYEYMQHRLIQANLKKDGAILEEVKGYLEEFIQVWTQAMKIVKK